MKNSPIAVLGFLIAASSAMAQVGTGFTISDLSSVYRQLDSYTHQAIPSADFRPNVSDYVGCNWWFYRVDGIDAREEAFKNAIGTTASGNTAVTEWAFPNFSASTRYQVRWIGFEAGRLDVELTVTNTAATAISLNLFNIVNATPTGFNSARATYVGTGDVRAANSVDWGMSIRAANPTAFLGGGDSPMRILLLNENVDNLTNSGYPFGPAAYANIYQFVLPLESGESAVLNTSIVVPEPSGWAAMGVGIGLLMCRREFRRHAQLKC